MQCVGYARMLRVLSLTSYFEGDLNTGFESQVVCLFELQETCLKAIQINLANQVIVDWILLRDTAENSNLTPK